MFARVMEVFWPVRMSRLMAIHVDGCGRVISVAPFIMASRNYIPSLSGYAPSECYFKTTSVLPGHYLSGSATIDHNGHSRLRRNRKPASARGFQISRHRPGSQVEWLFNPTTYELEG